MRHPVRALALACALTLTPACAAIGAGDVRFENPMAAARTLDQRAYALLSAYAAVLEEATDIVRDPAAPPAFKRALGEAERAATPAVETLQIAIAAYMRAERDLEGVGEGAPIERAANALAIAARRLNEAVAAAEGPVNELQQLVRARRA
ncbi:MAG: hypothetical protein AB7P07_11915 [Hyphomonadaceae bacterium]